MNEHLRLKVKGAVALEAGYGLFQERSLAVKDRSWKRICFNVLKATY